MNTVSLKVRVKDSIKVGFLSLLFSEIIFSFIFGAFYFLKPQLLYNWLGWQFFILLTSSALAFFKALKSRYPSFLATPTGWLITLTFMYGAISIFCGIFYFGAGAEAFVFAHRIGAQLLIPLSLAIWVFGLTVFGLFFGIALRSFQTLVARYQLL
jgi:hypothetical protein